MQKCLLLIWIWSWARLGSLDFSLGLDRHQLNFEDEGCVGADAAARTATSAIGKLRRNKQLPLRADGHELQGLRPTFDDAAHRKCRRLAVLVGAIEFCVVN